MTQWKPISTAPKDGTNILLFGTPYSEEIAAIGVGHWVQEWSVREEFVRKARDGDVYRTVREDCGYWSADLYGVSHWMPLPEPPRAD